MKGHLRPGEGLGQGELAEELQVSRQPVREALRRLESEGLVVRTTGRRFVVREYDEEDARESYYLRQLLEAEAARLAAERVLPQELGQLKGINESMAKAAATNDTQQAVELNIDFHRLIYESARMPGLTRLINQLWRGHTVFTPLAIPGRASRSVKEHQAIISALEERNSGKAAAAMRDHIERASREYFSSQGTGSSVAQPMLNELASGRHDRR